MIYCKFGKIHYSKNTRWSIFLKWFFLQHVADDIISGIIIVNIKLESR